MSWAVEAYREPAGAGPVVSSECEALVLDPGVGDDAAGLVGWLKAAQAGDAAPQREPDAPVVGGRRLKYRNVGGVVMIFGLWEAQRRLVVLRFARSASALPTVADLTSAGIRWDAWRAEHDV